MSKLRKWLAKDKYVIARGSIVMLVLVMLCAVLFTNLLIDFAETSGEARAADAASRFSSQFEQMVRDWYRDLDASAAMIDEEPEMESLFMDVLYEHYPYSEVGILSDGMIRHSDGSVSALESKSAYIYAEDGVPKGRFIMLADDSILLCATTNESKMTELVVRYDAEGVADVLRSMFGRDYGFAVYNASTGTYLVNCTDFTEGGYYDALLALNANGSASNLLRDGTAIALMNDDSNSFYIAQQRTAVRPWNVALVIPAAAFGTFATQLRWMPYAAVGAVLLLIAMHLLFVFFCGRRMRLETRYVTQSLKESERMLADLAGKAEVTLFIYQRGQKNPMRCYDGLGLFGAPNGDMRLTTMHALEEACGLDEADAERLHGRISELDHGGVAELMLRGALPDREERKLRFELDARTAEESIIIGSIRDCTQEMLTHDRAEFESNYLEANMQRTIAVWTLNVTRNVWRCVHIKDVAASSLLGLLSNEGWRDYTSDLNSTLREYIHPADYGDHVQRMSIQSIAGFYRSGRTEINLDYRVLSTDRESYEWHRMNVHLYPDSKTEDIRANIYVFDVDVEKKAELERGERKKIFKKTLRALSGIYYALYYVDLDNDLCYAAKSHDGQVVTQICTPYRETFDEYLEGIHPEDRDEIRNMLDSFNMRKSFVEGSRFWRREYRRKSGDGYKWAAIIIQPARYENGRIKDVVIALRNLVNHKHELDLE